MDAVKPSPHPPHSPEIEELLALYALEALDGEDLRLVEAHLAAGCPECEAELGLLRGTVEGLATSPAPVTPSETTRARLLAQLPPVDSSSRPSPGIDSGRRGTRPRRGVGLSALAIAAMLLLVAGWGWLAARREADALRSEHSDLTALRAKSEELARTASAAQAQREHLVGELAAARAREESLTREVAAARSERERLARDVTAAETQNARLARDLRSAQAQSERLATAMAIISAPGMRPITLAALKAPAGAEGHTFIDPVARKAVFVAANLPQLAADKTYELWFIADGKPVAAGTFGVDSSGRSGTVEVSGVAPLDHIQAWAVTVEPRGGVPQPTGTMVLKG
jgi:anti-sigma-K factor RskA